MGGNLTVPPAISKVLGSFVLPNGIKYYRSSIDGRDFSTGCTYFLENLIASGAFE